MKKLFLVLSVIVLALTSCTDFETSTPKDTSGNPVHSQRIHGVEETLFDGVTYTIIEVDGREYVCQYNGGMCLIPKDSLK